MTVERDVVETAYWLRTLHRYGTEGKAFAALRRRKAAKDMPLDELRNAFNTMLRLHDATMELIDTVCNT